MKICNECGEKTEGMDRNNRGLYCTFCGEGLVGAPDAPKPKPKPRTRRKSAPAKKKPTEVSND